MILEVEGKAGKGKKTVGNKGYVKMNLSMNIYDKKYIAVDNYVGNGDTYKEREKEKIIISNGKNYFTFDGLDSLISALKK